MPQGQHEMKKLWWCEPEKTSSKWELVLEDEKQKATVE